MLEALRVYLPLQAEALETEGDALRFIEFALTGLGRWTFDGPPKARICLREGESEASVRRAVCARTEELLRERGDAVSVAELLETWPYATEPWLAAVLDEGLSEALEEDVNGQKGYKLVAHYYFPDDLSEAVVEAVEAALAAGEVPSADCLSRRLDGRYACSFRDDYALGEATFKRVVTRFDAAHRGWKGSVLVTDEKSAGSHSPLALFQARHPGIFTTSEYVAFGVKTFGWEEKAVLRKTSQFGKTLFRYDRIHWSSPAYFREAVHWNAELERSLTQFLNDLRGSAAYFQMGTVTRQTLDALPDLRIGDRRLDWTQELLVSVAWWCLPDIRVLNHAVALNQVTEILVPPEVDGETDVLAYMEGIYRQRCFYRRRDVESEAAYCEAVVGFLVETGVRQNRTQQLRNAVEQIVRASG